MAIISHVRIDDSTPSSIPVVCDVSIVDSGPVHGATVVTRGLAALVVLSLIFV